MAVSAVFFDLFGTLVVADDEPSAWQQWLEALHLSCKEAGAGVARDRLAEVCEDFFSRTEPVEDGGDLTVYERRLARLLREIGADAAADRVRRVAELTATAWQARFAVDPEAARVLGGLAERVPLALVSNFDHPPTARRALGESGLERHFSAVVISGEVGVQKPDPAIFRGPLARLGVEPGRAVHVGDAVEDVVGARAAGLRPILVRRPGARPSPCPDPEGVTVIARLVELPGLLGWS